MWAGKDSNLRRANPTDLQSVLVDHLSTCPKIFGYSKLARGFEPTSVAPRFHGLAPHRGSRPSGAPFDFAQVAVTPKAWGNSFPTPLCRGFSQQFTNFIFKAGERFRTPDLLITSQLLYQLSYASLIFTDNQVQTTNHLKFLAYHSV